jgi:CSLREA domain-containing protein
MQLLIGSLRGRVLLLVAAVAVVLAVQAAFATQAPAGAAKLTVNSTANDDDGSCDHPPGPGIDCTLHEAIDAANAGLGNLINFHPATFPEAQPGTIFLDQGSGPLPFIIAQITIDAKGTGVILDGDTDNDGFGVPWGIVADAQKNGFDFELNGGGNTFVIRDVGSQITGPNGFVSGVALMINGLPFEICKKCKFDVEPAGPPSNSLGDVRIDGVDIENAGGIGIEILGTNLDNIDITNNDVEASGDAVLIHADANFGTGVLLDNNVDVTGNRILGGDDGVDIDYQGTLRSTINSNVSNNPSITGLGDDAIDHDFCDLSSCDAGAGTINLLNNGNTKLHASEDGLDMDINAGNTAPGDGATMVNAQFNENGLVDAANENGVEIDIQICCDTSDSVSTTSVSDNADIIGDSDGVDVDVSLCCGDNNSSTVDVNDNGEIEGQTDDGVEVNNDAGEVGNTADSDANDVTTNVNGNERITGGGTDGVFVNNEAGSGDGDADDNTSTISVNDNGAINGDDEGVDIDGDAGSDTGDSADNNTSTLTVMDNGEIDGDTDDGVEIDGTVGTDEGDDGDDNRASATVSGNDAITGRDDDGIEVDLFSGGQIRGSEGNSTETDITDNGDIRGGLEDDGVDVDLDVCCDPANTNTLNISENRGDIVGEDDGGMDLEVDDGGGEDSGARNIVTIMDNEGDIRGDDDDGIELDVCDGTLGCVFDTTGVEQRSLTTLTISGNNISNSEDDGIDLCCGDFEEEGVKKSIIRDNIITHNRDHGMEIHSSFGLNIGPNNVISENGDDPTIDRGIEIDRESYGVDVPANQNRITENSIFDNIGAGIDQEGSEGHGVGCITFGDGTDPNDCLPHPKVSFIGAGDLVTGVTCSECHVEIFIADATPADQAGPVGEAHAGVQHGEGRTFLVRGTADAAGNFSIALPCGQAAGELTTTASDKLKNTSEFGPNFAFPGSASCGTATPTITNTPPPATETNTPGPATSTPTAGPPTATNTPVVPPTATRTPTAGPTKECGDVNDSGGVNAVDALLILQVVAGLLDEASLVNPTSADVDGDGEITSIDAALVLQREAGLVDDLGQC